MAESWCRGIQSVQNYFSKVWKPGDFVSQGELVRKTGVQISPIRDALHKLSAEGLVIITLERVYKVTQLSIKLFVRFFT